LKSGQVQWIDRPTFQQVIDLQADPAVKVESSAGRLFAALWMNPDLEPFQDVRVRQALNHAIDLDSLRDAVFLGLADPADTIVPPMVEGSDSGGVSYPYDPEAARALLAEAGYADGLEVEIVYSDLYTWLEAAAVQTADQLSDVGITATPRRITGSDMRASAAPSGRDLPLFAWEDGPIVLDAVYTLALIAHTDGVANRNGYSNPEVDAAIDAARVEMDPEARLEYVREAQRLLLADAPYVLIGYPSLFEAMAPDIVGWVAHPDDHERWYDLRVAE
jgi:ABC-type transport system substrate-binding protein